MSHYPLSAVHQDRRYTILPDQHRSYYPPRTHPTWNANYLAAPSVDTVSSSPSYTAHLGGAFATTSSGWSLEGAAAAAAASYTPRSAEFVSELHPTITGYSSVPSEYPESSQRTNLPSVSPNPPQDDALPQPEYSYKNDLPRSPSHSPDFSPKNWGDDFYSLQEESQSSRQPSAPPSLTADFDGDDSTEGCFIMEMSMSGLTKTPITLESQAPPTEVPLRATQASKEMRKMMGVFRLNPFAMHSGEGRGVLSSSWCGCEARPLDEEPLIFEFQLDLDDAVPPSPGNSEQLRAFSPDFELHRHEVRGSDQDDAERSDWGEHKSESGLTHSPTPWELEEHFSSSASTSTDIVPNSTTFSSSTTRIHTSVAHPYIRKTSYSSQHPHHHTQPHHSAYLFGGSGSSVEVHRMSARGDAGAAGSDPCESPWARGEYVHPSRSNYAHTNATNAANSPGLSCNAAVLPSITSANRRWSLPDSSNLGTTGQFLM
ncbi:hypothetical protein BDQ17DRAFT_1007598 [Cyathus striatus]|nr:hypothetical protein BDQ17DRAFT_1007598 [Cyathus striatus]